MGRCFADTFNVPQRRDSIRKRLEIVRKWKEVYVEEFIPLAHGVRQLGIYYNDAVRPDDPYEFMNLLNQDEMLASKRNNRIAAMASIVRQDKQLKTLLSDFDSAVHAGAEESWVKLRKEIGKTDPGELFLDQMDDLLRSDADIAYRGKRLSEHPELFLHTILELVNAAEAGIGGRAPEKPPTVTADVLQSRLIDAVGKNREAEALEMMELGRLSWRLRDDDNILLGRLESQLLRSLNCAAERLRKRGQLAEYERLNDRVSLILADALVYPPDHEIELSPEAGAVVSDVSREAVKARQIIGQPAGKGVATGQAMIVREAEDTLNFKAGNVLVCEAIQPTMTHIVPLACAIVERRGGMLIHGAIIARELGIPCVNGVPEATKSIKIGELVTVDGYLGIVTVGPPEFHAETAHMVSSEKQQR